MKFAHLRVEGQTVPRLATVVGDSAIFLDEVMEHAPRDLQELIERGERGLDAVRTAVDVVVSAGGDLTPVADLRHSSAVLRPPQVLAIGANYAAHASELKLRSETAMTVFSLWPNSLTGHGQTTTWPEDLSAQVDYEPSSASSSVAPRAASTGATRSTSCGGYTVVNDITARDIQFSEAQWSRCKSFDGFTPTGPPVVVTADEIADPQDLWLTTNLDGRILQDASTNEMVRGVAEIISYLSRSATIPAGTLISTAARAGPATRAARRCSSTTA